MSFQTSPAGIEVRVCPDKEAAAEAALAELCAVLARPDRPLVSFATGATFTFMLTRLEQEVQAGRVSLDGAVATHLDEYEGFLPRQQGSMVHELCAACPSLIGMLDRGAFHPVPCVADPAHAAAHERKLAELGGVQLQFLGIGRNGHLAFHEPGVPFDRGYHIAELSESTRRDAVARFAPLPVPHRAVTAGVATILRGKRIVLCAFGKAKAPAVRAMLQGEPSAQCPASALRAHNSALILLDSDAASEL
jgi:glucosamine-6-phosphate deaminase